MNKIIIISLCSLICFASVAQRNQININSQTTGTLSPTRGGTGLTTLGTAGQVLQVNDEADGLEWGTASGGSGLGGSTGSTDNAVLRADGTGGSTVQASGVTIDDSNNITSTGAFRSTYIFPFQADGTNDASSFIVDWLTNTVANSGTLSNGVDIFLSDAGVELQDKTAIVTYNVTLTKSDGSDSSMKRYIVGYRKDGAADPVQVGTAALIFDVGNATPGVSFSIVSGLPSISIADNGSGGWKVKVWAQVSRSN